MAALDRPDVLLVDEAAQALEPELAIAFTRHPRRALLVGDPAQLPASLTSDIARRFGHATSLMERLTKTDEDGRARVKRAIQNAPGDFILARSRVLRRSRDERTVR